MVKLICGILNHEMTKSLVRHPYVGQLKKDEKIVVADMTKFHGEAKKYFVDVEGAQ